MAGQVIAVPQQDGEIVITFPGVRRVPLEVADGKVTVHDDDVAAAVLASVAGAHQLDETAADFDPDQHTVAEVNGYLAAHPESAGRVLDAERDGRARRGVLEGPHVPADEESAE